MILLLGFGGKNVQIPLKQKVLMAPACSGHFDTALLLNFTYQENEKSVVQTEPQLTPRFILVS